jgi:chromosomal replication initiation ATPase DnaA
MKRQIFKSYADKISTLYDIELDSLFEKNKAREIVDARQMLYYLCKERNIKIIQIKTFMQEQGYFTEHSTIIHGINVVKKNTESDQDYRTFIKNINNELHLTRCI